MSAAQYRILSPAGEEREDGSADVEVADGALVLAPSAGGVLRVPFGHISSVTQPGPFAVRITLADGNLIELTRLGVMRTQLLAELRDGRGDEAAQAVAAVGEAEVFSGVSGDEPVQVRVYDDALLVMGAAAGERRAAPQPDLQAVARRRRHGVPHGSQHSLPGAFRLAMHQRVGVAHVLGHRRRVQQGMRAVHQIAIGPSRSGDAPGQRRGAGRLRGAVHPGNDRFPGRHMCPPPSGPPAAHRRYCARWRKGSMKRP